jgi:tRNA(Ile)-lysidine synthase
MAKTSTTSFKKTLSGSLSDLFEEDSFFIVGVSGGPDSMALLYLLHTQDVNALTVHVNYGKRGKESDKDQELVEQMSNAWGFECCSIRLEPEAAKGENFQNWARNQRYQYFRDLKEAYKADAIVTAHHQDDQLETILQKLFRGSSPSAWQGMSVWNGDLFRPFLSYTKQEILDFCEAEAVPYRIDKSNKNSEFARNFIRNDFIHAMDNLFPGWQKNILDLPRLGKTFEHSIAYISDQVSSKNTILLNKFSKLPEELKPAVIKTILDQAGMKGDYSRGQLQELSEIEFLQTGKSLKVGPMTLTRDRDHIHLQAEQTSPVISEEIDEDQARKGWILKNILIELKPEPIPLPALRLDSSKLNWPLKIRNWDAGDVFQPLGMSGSQNISDHLTNRKIPTTSREKALVLCGSDGTIYAIIYPDLTADGDHGAISERAKCESTTETFLTINFT